jgi:hypothetical protein
LSEALGIYPVGNEWVKEWTLLRITRCKRGPLVIWTNIFDEISAVLCKLVKIIEKPCNDLLVIHQ